MSLGLMGSGHDTVSFSKRMYFIGGGSHKYHFRRDKGFVSIKACLLREIFVATKKVFVGTNIILSGQRFRRDIFFDRNKICVLSQQT